jgi:hypothetical protein
MHFCASTEHVASVIVSAHVMAVVLQTGSTLQLHAAAPVGPVHVWWVPQGVGAP